MAKKTVAKTTKPRRPARFISPEAVRIAQRVNKLPKSEQQRIAAVVAAADASGPARSPYTQRASDCAHAALSVGFSEYLRGVARTNPNGSLKKAVGAFLAAMRAELKHRESQWARQQKRRGGK